MTSEKIKMPDGTYRWPITSNKCWIKFADEQKGKVNNLRISMATVKDEKGNYYIATCMFDPVTGVRYAEMAQSVDQFEKFIEHCDNTLEKCFEVIDRETSTKHQ